MSELRDAKMAWSQETGRWVVDLLWLDDDDPPTWHLDHKEFDRKRRAMGFCECYGWTLPLAMWQRAAESEPLNLPEKFEIQEIA